MKKTLMIISFGLFAMNTNAQEIEPISAPKTTDSIQKIELARIEKEKAEKEIEKAKRDAEKEAKNQQKEIEKAKKEAEKIKKTLRK